jgi:general secretion pathway protein D
MVVQDGETIVIGGLIEDKASQTRAGVPFLSSIPLIGYLFSSTKGKTEKTELIILITPHVVKNFDEASLVTREFQEKLWQVDKLLRTSEDYWKDYKRP